MAGGAQILQATRQRRLRGRTESWTALPPLRTAERELLLRWAAPAAQTRRFATLRQEAGSGRLELAEALLERLLDGGQARLAERFERGAWWPVQLLWVDLPRLQAALGLASAQDRADGRAALHERLDRLCEAVDGVPQVQLAARALDAALPSAVLGARIELLESLSTWCQEQRRGLRQDFALHARPHTKAIGESEWTWLGSVLDLAALGVERFAGVLWLASAMRLEFDPRLGVDLSALPFAGLPQRAIDQVLCVVDPPRRWWLIENRASFERQAAQRAPDEAIVWIAGRPGLGWQQALCHLLRLAPAPAAISTDLDPAGLEIAATVAELWQAAGLPWSLQAMDASDLAQAKTQPLAPYDQRLLVQQLARADWPAPLRALAQAMESGGVKAEQEGWL